MTGSERLVGQIELFSHKETNRTIEATSLEDCYLSVDGSMIECFVKCRSISWAFGPLLLEFGAAS